MKKISWLVLLLVGVFSVAQMPAKPEELKKLQFLVGKFGGTNKMYMDPSQEPTESKGSIESKWILDDRYLNWNFNGEFMGMKMNGILTMSYDPMQKKFVGTWIDNMGNGILYFRGNFEGEKLVLVSDPAEAEGMGVVSMKAIYYATDKGFKFDLDMKMQENWIPMMRSEFKKK